MILCSKFKIWESNGDLDLFQSVVVLSTIVVLVFHLHLCYRVTQALAVMVPG